jgi:hypothetical protein
MRLLASSGTTSATVPSATRSSILPGSAGNAAFIKPAFIAQEVRSASIR